MPRREHASTRAIRRDLSPSSTTLALSFVPKSTPRRRALTQQSALLCKLFTINRPPASISISTLLNCSTQSWRRLACSGQLLVCSRSRVQFRIRHPFSLQLQFRQLHEYEHMRRRLELRNILSEMLSMKLWLKNWRPMKKSSYWGKK
jgi:hypothetical protein